MLSLLKMAIALTLVRRSWVSWSLEIGRPMSTVRNRRSAAVHPVRPSIVRSEAISLPSSPRSKSSSKGRTIRT